MNEITKVTGSKVVNSIPMMDTQVFEQMQRVGKMLAMSPLFPDHLRKGDRDQALANGVLVLNMAMRLNEAPLTVAQNIYFVGSKPGFSTSYLISKANQHGVFENPIDWEVKGTGDDLSVTATATIAATKKKVTFTCDMAMARAENWVKNAKYKSMPELMLRYRSAAALIRLYCPEVMVGVPAQIEIETGSEMRDITPQGFSQAAQKEAAAEAPVEAEIVEEDAKPADAAELEGAREAKAEEVDPEQFRGMLNMIINDLNDAPSVDSVLDFYGQQVDELKAKAPTLHNELQAEIAKFREAEANQGAVA